MTVLACALAPAPPDGSSVAPGSSAGLPQSLPREELSRLAARSVLFAHGCVGDDILEGVARLVASAGVGPRVTLLDRMVAPSPGVLGHVLLPQDGHPADKIQAFAEVLDRLGDRAPDVALMKLCHGDLDAPGADVAALLELYRKTLADVEGRHAGTAFVHVTVPLTRPLAGVKGTLRWLLGKSPRGNAGNARREELNARIRAAYGERVFDLARLQSTGPAGERCAVEWQGRAVPALCPAYTEDGERLNVLGQDVVARGLVSHLAGVPMR